MANRTDPLARTIHGTNPQNLIEKIVRTKVYQSLYWKEHCFALSAETIIDKAVELRHVGGTYGGQQQPTQFLCLLLKMLQIQPDEDIVIEFIKDDNFKYLRLLGAMYLRLVGKPVQVYDYLEPLFNDYRRVRLRQRDGTFILSHVDELVEQMLYKDWLFEIALPRLPARHMLEAQKQLDPRISVLDEMFDEAQLEAEAGEAAEAARKLEEQLRLEQNAKGGRGQSVSPPADPDRRRARSRSREHRKRSYSRSRSRSPKRRSRSVSRSRSRDRRYRGYRTRDRDDDRRGRDRDREKDKGKDRERGRDKDKAKKKKEKKAEPEVDPEIAEANALRAKLGIKPLRV